MKKHTWIIAAVVVLLAFGVVVFYVAEGALETGAQPIPAGSYFKDVKRLSSGSKPDCLNNVSSAENAVNALQPKGYGYTLDEARGIQIIDMPAGMYDATVHTFESNQAKGTITFSDKNQQAVTGALKNFNYTATVNPATKHWKLTYFIACNK